MKATAQTRKMWFFEARNILRVHGSKNGWGCSSLPSVSVRHALVPRLPRSVMVRK